MSTQLEDNLQRVMSDSGSVYVEEDAHAISDNVYPQYRPVSLCDNLTLDLAITDSPIFHVSRQSHEDDIDNFFQWIGFFTRAFRSLLEDASGIS